VLAQDVTLVGSQPSTPTAVCGSEYNRTCRGAFSSRQAFFVRGAMPQILCTYSRRLRHKSSKREEIIWIAHIHGIRIGRLGRARMKLSRAQISARRRWHREATYFATGRPIRLAKIPRQVAKVPLARKPISAPSHWQLPVSRKVIKHLRSSRPM